MKFSQSAITAAVAKLRAAAETADNVRSNINPERGFADELEAEVATMPDAIKQASSMLEYLAILAADEERKEQAQENARSQAKAQAESIAEMVAALECDYDRLQELKDEREALADALADCEAAYAYHDSDDTKTTPEWDDLKAARLELAEWDEQNAEELAELVAAAGDCTSQDDAQQRITEDPLSIEVRSGWQSAGEELTPADFTILLCTGGPACRIVGELDEHNEPERAWIEYQDWFTPWVQYHGEGCNSEALLTYCRQFLFAA